MKTKIINSILFLNNNEKKSKRELSKSEKLPLASKIIYIITAFSFIILIIMKLSVSFSDFFNRTIGAFFRAALSYLTGWYPASIAENLILLSPLLLIILICVANKYYCESWRSVITYIGILASFAGLIFSIYVFTFAAGFSTQSLDKQLGIEVKNVSAEELYETSLELCNRINEEANSIYFLHNGFSDMPYTLTDMGKKLNEAYRDLCSSDADQYSFMRNFNSKLKNVTFSKAMSYTQITGVYTYFTGESNINVYFPDFTIPYTAAHEMAHQRGISREDEANMIAFLVCEKSSDPYIRYSGYVSMLQYVANALYGADRDLYYEIKNMLDSNVNKELASYSEFSRQFDNTVISEISTGINETSIKIQGSKSYGMVVDLAVAYFGTKKN